MDQVINLGTHCDMQFYLHTMGKDAALLRHHYIRAEQGDFVCKISLRNLEQRYVSKVCIHVNGDESRQEEIRF